MKALQGILILTIQCKMLELMLLKTKPTDIGKKLGPEAHWMLIKWSHLKSTCGLLTSIEVLILGHRTGHPGGTELGKRSKALITFRSCSWPRLRFLTWKEKPPRWLELGKSFDCLPHMCRSRSGCVELIKTTHHLKPSEISTKFVIPGSNQNGWRIIR